MSREHSCSSKNTYYQFVTDHTSSHINLVLCSQTDELLWYLRESNAAPPLRSGPMFDSPIMHISQYFDLTQYSWGSQVIGILIYNKVLMKAWQHSHKRVRMSQGQECGLMGS